MANLLERSSVPLSIICLSVSILSFHILSPKYTRLPLARQCVEPGSAERGGNEQIHLLDTGAPTALLWPCGAFING